MNDEQLLRYSRHLLLPEIDVSGQQRLLEATVLVVGLGGLGSAATLYLGASGIGRLMLADDDLVELSNLQRQVIHNSAAIGRAKVDSAAATVRAINPDVRTVPIRERLDEAGIGQLLDEVSLVLDCSDNFATRHAINAACFAGRVPLVSGAALGWEGQIAVFDPRTGTGPCYRCLYPDANAVSERSCARNGVAGPVVGTIGVLQALQALKLLCGAGDALCGELLAFDALALEFHRLRIAPRANCPVCAA
ncbi:MAG: molybdopterin-synthase adenylyltransferase MoeB [Pseudomonadales bacterium]|jgi:molybdopterin/thiamine biosynthesis adenylyltransferase|nr:molybdopterin-synthase adenylyltransferase MoeB [Gammaproteobacteria bacterium]MBP6051739.1 molybdopterin-synthase adenylyltransferase MoeB [Pseudomonadales bacterium]MBK6584748.1 molybdopterin-synthase adenylyltransferase MoeB [Gammaproteobacteria bacterium]MBK7519743.1 molybdopterin-synthase adenylyltransferase MoeB [Gammaproteobacteria bacterium]MBK8306529.1 molybdopterin-synthase adenylyltransferase MoeB [Gammaproteobacteria bacterium]